MNKNISYFILLLFFFPHHHPVVAASSPTPREVPGDHHQDGCRPRGGGRGSDPPLPTPKFRPGVKSPPVPVPRGPVTAARAPQAGRAWPAGWRGEQAVPLAAPAAPSRIIYGISLPRSTFPPGTGQEGQGTGVGVMHPAPSAAFGAFCTDFWVKPPNQVIYFSPCCKAHGVPRCTEASSPSFTQTPQAPRPLLGQPHCGPSPIFSPSLSHLQPHRVVSGGAPGLPRWLQGWQMEKNPGSAPRPHNSGARRGRSSAWGLAQCLCCNTQARAGEARPGLEP